MKLMSASGAMSDKTTIPKCLVTMFTDPRFDLFDRYLSFARINQERLGVVLATIAPKRRDCGLSQSHFDRLMDAKATGKIDHAFVVAAKINGTGYGRSGLGYEYLTAACAETIKPKLVQRPTIMGIRGPFWLLQLYEINEAAVPF